MAAELLRASLGALEYGRRKGEHQPLREVDKASVRAMWQPGVLALQSGHLSSEERSRLIPWRILTCT